MDLVGKIGYSIIGIIGGFFIGLVVSNLGTFVIGGTLWMLGICDFFEWFFLDGGMQLVSKIGAIAGSAIGFLIGLAGG